MSAAGTDGIMQLLSYLLSQKAEMWQLLLVAAAAAQQGVQVKKAGGASVLTWGLKLLCLYMAQGRACRDALNQPY